MKKGDPMPNACCAKPIVKIIKVDDVEAGLKGLDLAIQNVYLLGLEDEEKLKNELIRWVRDFGNYIAPSREEAYKKALLREYRLFVAEAERQRLDRLENQQPRTRRKGKFQQWKLWFSKSEKKQSPN